MEELGLTTAAAVDIGTLEDRLRQEALETRGLAVMALMIGAFARKP